MSGSPQVRILVTASSLQGHARKKASDRSNSTRASLLERCLEVQALRCRWSDDARPLHLPASHAEPVGMPPVLNIACSTVTHIFYPWGVRQIGGILHIGMQCVRRCAWEECVRPGWSDRMPMAFSVVRLRAQHGNKLVWPTRNASSLHRLKLVLRDQ